MLGLKGMAIVGVIMLTMTAGFYWYYQDSQKRMTTLIENSTKLEQAVEVNEQTIKDLNTLNQAANNELRRVNNELYRSRLQNTELINKFAKNDLGLLGSQKPELVQRIINNASNQVGRCFELLSGAQLTEQERNARNEKEFNSECPWLFNDLVSP